MKKIHRRLLFVFVLLASVAAVLNINVTRQQGIDYERYTISLPLYLKILDFFDRHYNYQLLAKKIISGAGTDEERVMRVFNWTYRNIRQAPGGFPVIDDHIWHVIIRGYGTMDQYNDAFTTLCNYAGAQAFFFNVYSRDKAKKRVFSAVRFGGKWHIFDPYCGVYFKDARQAECIGEMPDVDYDVYFDNFPEVSDPGFTRPNLQSPLRRLLFEVCKRK